MNNESPLVPQGSFLEQKNKSRTRVKIAVFVVLAIHGIGVLALLMQGCKPSTPSSDPTATNAAPVFEPTTNPPIVPDTSLSAQPDTNSAAAVPSSGAVPPPTTPQVTGTDYKIQKGDSFATIAKKFNVSVKALTDANPGLEPTRLQIGQTVHVPPPSTPATPAANGSAPPPSGEAGQTYTVKSGDSLIKIATQFGTTAKAIRSANGLTTDRIRVGQKLKIPGKGTGTGATPVNGSATSSPAGTPTQ